MAIETNKKIIKKPARDDLTHAVLIGTQLAPLNSVTPGRTFGRVRRHHRAVQAVYRGVTVVLITFVMLPCTAPFSTCGLAALLAPPMAIDAAAHAAATTISAADPAQAVSSFDEAFKSHVVMPDTTHTPTVQVVSDAARPPAVRATSPSFVPLVLRL